MVDQKLKETYEEANNLFDLAQEHMCKPEEDVVTYVVCFTLYKSVILYLKAWLLQNGHDFEDEFDLEQTLNRCREVDKRFVDLKLEPLFNANVTDEVWMSLDKVREFIDLTRQTRVIIGIN